MSDFDDDFDNYNDDEFNDFNRGNSLKDAWQTNPLLKIFVIFAGVVVVIAAIVIFGFGEDASESRLSSVPESKETLGGEVSQNYADALNEVNEQRYNQAVQQGTSSIPMMVNPEQQDLLTESQDLPPYQEYDPLATFRSAVEDGNQNPGSEVVQDDPVLVQPEELFGNPGQPLQQPVPAPSPEAVQQLAEAMGERMTLILGDHDPKEPRITQVTPNDYFEQKAAEEAERLADLAQSTMVDTDGDGIPDTELGNGGDDYIDSEVAVVENVIVPAGTINYAQILIEANSDVPGPVLAQLMSGPLTGARLIGEFNVSNEFLVLTFNSIVIDGLNQSISAIAIDPATTLPGVATEVDRRYWTRVLLPAAARFLEGVGSAIAEDTETTVTVTGDTVIQEQSALDFEQEIGRGVEAGIGEIADYMDERADDVQTLVRVSRGTPVGVFFTEPVVEVQE